MAFITDVLKKFFGTKSERDIKEIQPYVDKALAAYTRIDKLSHDELRDESGKILESIHSAPWGEPVVITPFFTITKLECGIESLSGTSFRHRVKNVDIVYFDAFSPNIQPELWSREIFEGVYEIMSERSLLITYSSRGVVKSALREAGFEVKRLKGPAGKRHITLAVRSGTF